MKTAFNIRVYWYNLQTVYWKAIARLDMQVKITSVKWRVYLSKKIQVWNDEYIQVKNTGVKWRVYSSKKYKCEMTSIFKSKIQVWNDEYIQVKNTGVKWRVYSSKKYKCEMTSIFKSVVLYKDTRISKNNNRLMQLYTCVV